MNKLWNLQNYSAEALHRTVVAAGELPVSDSGERLHPEHEENPRERRRFVLRALLCAG